jgi:hypothetical protein
LTRTNGDIKGFGVEIHEGRFHAVESSLADFSFSSGLQISLVFGEHTARGWVHVEDVLRMTRLRKLNIGAVLRIIVRENTEDDDVALLEYLSNSLAP